MTLKTSSSRRPFTRTGKLRGLADAALAINANLTVEAILERITGEARTLIGAHKAIATLAIEQRWKQAMTSVSRSESLGEEGRDGQVGDVARLCHQVCETNEPMRLTAEELIEHPDVRPARTDEGEPIEPSGGWLAVPFVAADGLNIGLLQLTGRFDGDFDADDEAVAVQLAQLASVAIQNARLYEEAREAHRRKDEFLALLGHELRNPLAPIQTALELMRLKGDRNVTAERRVVERQVRHMTQLVDDLLDVSRVVRGQISLVTEPLAIGRVIRRAVEMVSPLLEARGHELEVDLLDAPLVVQGDPMRLSQVMANLLSNAAKYTEPGGRIRIIGILKGDRVRVGIEDTGIGLSPEILPTLFDPFIRGPGSDDSGPGSLGLGLALVENLVGLHRGRVWAESPGPGAGSTFWVELPAATATDALHTPPLPSPRLEPSKRPGKQILLVDDNVDAAKLIARGLRMMGHTVVVAHDGPKALEQIADFQPEVGILDIGLPVMDGHELARRLREELGGELRLIAFTGYGQPADRARSEAAGFDLHLVKPIDLEKLEEAITGERCC